MLFDYDATHFTPKLHDIEQLNTVLSKAPFVSTIKWENWSGNLQYTPTKQDNNYYYMPEDFAGLSSIIKKANTLNSTQELRAETAINIRVSGQRHSISPLVVNDDTSDTNISTPHGKTWVVDLACYHDLGKDNLDNIVLDPQALTVAVNAGVKKAELEDFLAEHGYMLKTVTAGGPFSIGGITSIDVHGANINESIISSNVISYTVMGANGQKYIYDENSKKFLGYNPLQFHRTSLGTLGIITSVTLKVAPRPYKETIIPSYSYYSIHDKQTFIDIYDKLLFSGDYNSVESFYNPYARNKNILSLKWEIENTAGNTDKFAEKTISTNTTAGCDEAIKHKWGDTFTKTRNRANSRNYWYGNPR